MLTPVAVGADPTNGATGPTDALCTAVPVAGVPVADTGVTSNIMSVPSSAAIRSYVTAVAPVIGLPSLSHL